jgi:hypothetical protein
MTDKIPLDKMLQAIDVNNLEFYSSLTDEQKKAWSAWVALRYASSASGNNTYHYLLMTNSLVNVDFNTLRNHPELQWKLLALCGSGKKSFHQWIAPPKKQKKNKVYEFLSHTYPEYNTRDIAVLCDIITKDELTDLCKASGLDNKAIKDITK